MPPAGRCGNSFKYRWPSDNSINTTTQNFLGDKTVGTDSADTVGAAGDTLTLKGWTKVANNKTVTININYKYKNYS